MNPNIVCKLPSMLDIFGTITALWIPLGQKISDLERNLAFSMLFTFLIINIHTFYIIINNITTQHLS
jgi:hypothetical protein